MNTIILGIMPIKSIITREATHVLYVNCTKPGMVTAHLGRLASINTFPLVMATEIIILQEIIILPLLVTTMATDKMPHPLMVTRVQRVGLVQKTGNPFNKL